METLSLHEHVGRHYRSRQLDPTRLAELRTLAESAQTSRRTILWWAAAAAVVVTAVFIVQRMSSEATPTNVNDLVMQEVAKNHTKSLLPNAKPNTYETSNIGELSTFMTDLEFTCLHSPRLEELGLQPVGARYCSLQGERAAQIRLLDESGKAWTLYQCKATEVFDALVESEETVDGCTIRVWSEAGVVMGLAGPDRQPKPSP